jgi:DNA-directed RNA polymerase specialized sigma24 family protein
LQKLNEYIEKSYKNLLDISKRITSNRHPDYEDLLHETILVLYALEKEKINKIIKQKKLTFYIVRIMINQYQSNTSPYHKKYRKQYNDDQLKQFYIYTKEPLTKEKIEKLEKNEERLKWIEEKLQGLNWFDVSVFKLYYKEKFSLRTMSIATKISKSTLGKSIRSVKNYLKGIKDD